MEERRRRIAILSILLASLFVLIAGRVVLLALIDGSRLQILAHSEHTEKVEVSAPRGPIVDRNGIILALSAPARSLYARPRTVWSKNRREQLVQLARILGIDSDKLSARLKSKANFIWLARQVDAKTAWAVDQLGLAGIGSVNEFKRFYPEGSLAAAVIGMAGTDSQGLSGVEMRYDRAIRGNPLSLEIERDALGRFVLDSPEVLREARPGARVVLTLDSRLQALVETEMRQRVRYYRAKRGTAIVLDPFTGEILAMATVGADDSEPSDRLHNPAVQDVFEPGSTIKPLLAAIALDSRVVTPQSRIFCENGAWRLGAATIHDHGAHQWLTLEEIIARSSNIGAAKIALALGPKRVFDGLRAFGLGHPTGVDLPGEAFGILRQLQIAQRVELANEGFGQGLAVTPLQLVVAYGAIANGGLLLRPFVVREIYDPLGRRIFRAKPQIVRRVISPTTAHQVARLLRAVVEDPAGTGRLASIPNIAIAGKTGTAQMVNPVTHAYYQDRLVASFVGIAPADQPRLVVLVMLEDVGHGQFGGLVAAPAFKTIVASALDRLGLPVGQPSVTEASYQVADLAPFGLLLNSANKSSALAGSSNIRNFHDGKPDFVSSLEGWCVPYFAGLSLRHALQLAHRLNLELDVSGDGYVVAQSPAPGSPIPAFRRIKIVLAGSVEGSPLHNRFSFDRARADADRTISRGFLP